MSNTPSKSIEIRLPVIEGGSVKLFRYQPRPPGKKPVALVWVGLGSWVMLQSWGSVTRSQSESGKLGAAALGSAELP